MEDIKNMYLLDSDKTTVGVLSNRMPFSLPFFNDLQETSLDDFTNTLTFSVPANHEKALDLSTDKYILYPEASGNLSLYKIMEVTEATSATEYAKEIYCEISAQDDLIKDIVRPSTFIDATLDEVMDYILTGSEWVTGSVDDFPAMTYKIEEHVTKLEALVSAVQAYGGEFRFDYKVQGTDVWSQNVDVFEKIGGNQVGKTFIYGKDIVGVERKEDSTKLVTALIAVGKADEGGVPMSFNGAKLTGVPKGYETGVDWVGSVEAQEAYSRKGEHIFGVYKDDSANSPQELFENTLKALKEVERPIMSYKVDVVLLEKLAGYEHERAELGDTVLVQDKSVQPELYLSARLRKMSRSLTNPENDAVELGDYVALTPPVNKRLATLQAKIEKAEKVWNKADAIPAIQEKLDQVPSKDDLFSLPSNRLKVRYIRDYINGSNINTSNHWVEFQIYKQGVNLAKGLIPTFSTTLLGSQIAGNVTDEIIDSSRTAYTGKGLQWMQIDLGAVTTDIEYLKVWHSFADDRTYNNHYVDVSEDGILWIRIFNSDLRGTHVETVDGFTVPVNSSAILHTQNQVVNEVVKEVATLEDFKLSAEAQISQKVDAVAYNKKVEELNQSIAEKVGLEYVNGQLMDKANKNEVVTLDVIESAVNGLVSKTEYATDEAGRVQRLESAETRITQTEKDISFKASETKVTAVEDRLATAEASLTVQAGEIATRVTKEEVKKLAKLENSIGFRFLRYLGEGNSVDSDNKIVEIMVNNGDGVNVAKDKPVTAGNTDATKLHYITNGVFSNPDTASSLGANLESQWAMIDLGEVMSDLANIRIWHPWTDPTVLSYYKIQVSEDGINWLTLYDYKMDGTYAPTSTGFEIFVNQQKAIYSHASQIRETAEAISLKADAEIVDDLGARIESAEQRITPESITATVTSSSDFTEAMSGKADQSSVDSKAEAEDVLNLRADLTNNYTTKSELVQTADEFNFNFTNSGGVNLAQNSVGFGGTDFWTVTGNIDIVQNSELEVRGAGSGFGMVGTKISQVIPVQAGKYTISLLAKKVAQGTGYVKAVYDNGKSHTINLIDSTALEYERISFTIDVEGNQIELELQGSVDSGIIYTSLMLNVGALPLQWSNSSGEVYNANVQINGNGIKVSNSQYQGYTSITPEEFAGYYEVDGVSEKVFTLNKDTTIIAKAEIKQEINMSPMKIVPIVSDTLNGWAFVASE